MDKVKAMLVAEKGTLKSVQVWGRRRLTFPIKRQKDGIYIYFDYNGSNKSAEEVNKLFRVTDFVIRHLTVLRDDTPPPLPAGSVMGEGSQEATAATPVPAATTQAVQSSESPSTK